MMVVLLYDCYIFLQLLYFLTAVPSYDCCIFSQLFCLTTVVFYNCCIFLRLFRLKTLLSYGCSIMSVPSYDCCIFVRMLYFLTAVCLCTAGVPFIQQLYLIKVEVYPLMEIVSQIKVFGFLVVY